MWKNERSKKLYCETLRTTSSKKSVSLFFKPLQQAQKFTCTGSNKRWWFPVTDSLKNLSYLSLAISSPFYSKKLGIISPHFLMKSHMAVQTEYFSLWNVQCSVTACAKTKAFLPSSLVKLPLAPPVAVSKRAVRHLARPGHSAPSWALVPGFWARSFPAQWQKSLT